MDNRRKFIKKTAAAGFSLAGLGMSFSASSYARILGSTFLRQTTGLAALSALPASLYTNSKSDVRIRFAAIWQLNWP